MRSRVVPTVVLLLLALPVSGGAQSRAASTRDTVPKTMLPPAGKCRIWMEGVPASQQPAPTDCATALRQRPANGVVLYGPASRDAGGNQFAPGNGRPTNGEQERVDRAGSPAERALQERRDRDARNRRLQEERERDERMRLDQEQRAMNGRPQTRLIEARSAEPRNTPATPRSAGASSTDAGASSGGAKAAPPAPKTPPADKKKPE